MESSEYLATVAEMHAEARRRGLFFQNCNDAELHGRNVCIDERELLSFSSCSYLGLERHPALIRAVHDAVDRYGTQFSSSRGYLSAPRYDELEHALSALFGGFALVTSSTTLAHQVALPVLANEKDAIVMDHQVHHSVQVAATLARAAGTHVELVRHGELEKALELVQRLAKQHRTVWFACDGVFSMYGDLASFDLLQALLDSAPNVRLYIDDAHGMSWAGQNGRGLFLERMELGPRIVVATSLNKAFSAAGGCLVFAEEQEREKVRICGAPMVFSGPVQPPMLGAALASAQVHLSPEIVERQATLRARVEQCNQMLLGEGLPLLVANESPIFFLRLGLPRLAFAVAERLLAEDLYVNVSMYPSVPMRRAGIRLTLTAAHSEADVTRVVSALARHVPEAMSELGVSRDELDELFARTLPQRFVPARESSTLLVELADATAARSKGERITAPSSLTVEHRHSIEQIDRDLWDAACATMGACSWEAMACAERLFRDQPRREHNWKFHYVVVRDANDRVVCVTHFTESLCKDDMLMRSRVSAAVEARRVADPHFLSSNVVMVGSPLSEGNHVYLDRSGPWRQALACALEVGHRIQREANANMLLVRDLPAADAEMDGFMLDQGFVKVPMLDSHHLPIDWDDEHGMLASVSKRSRKYLRAQMEAAEKYAVRGYGVGSLEGGVLAAHEQHHLYRLYQNVASRKRRLNVFDLPENMIDAFLRSPAWEIVTLRLKEAAGGPSDGAPVAWYAAHLGELHYAPFLCGLDYSYVLGDGAYRQALFQMVTRAQRRGFRHVHLGMDADREKGRYGTVVRNNCVYAQVADHYSGAQLREIVAEVGIGERRGDSNGRDAA